MQRSPLLSGAARDRRAAQPDGATQHLNGKPELSLLEPPSGPVPAVVTTPGSLLQHNARSGAKLIQDFFLIAGRAPFLEFRQRVLAVPGHAIPSQRVLLKVQLEADRGSAHAQHSGQPLE